MHVATDGKYNLKILNDAFEGRAHENEEFDFVEDDKGDKKLKKRTKRPPKDPNAAIPPKPRVPPLESRDPRMEAVVADVMRRSARDWTKMSEGSVSDTSSQKSGEASSMAVAVYDEVGQRKKNREQLKMKAKAFTSNEPKKVGRAIFDIDAEPAGDSGTFVTGVGIPGKSKRKQREFTEAELKFYAFPEDELMDRVDQTEKEMHNMMKYLNAVENMMGGDDLAQIRRMLDYTSTSVKHHSKAYSGIKD